MRKIDDFIRELSRSGAEAYLTLDYENRNPVVHELTAGLLLTRKIAFLFSKGGLTIIAQTLDIPFLKNTPSLKGALVLEYRTWKEFLLLLEKSLVGFDSVMMDVSEAGLLPRVSLADYGSAAFVKGLGKKIVSSADLINRLTAVIDEEGKRSQKEAADILLRLVEEAFGLIRKRLLAGLGLNEYEVQSYLGRRMDEERLIFDDLPIVAVNANASNPHYQPTLEAHSPIRPGDLILIDIWAKKKTPRAVYADITWMAYAGEEVPARMAKPFGVLKESIDQALAFLTRELPNRAVKGCEVDDLVRSFIEGAGYGAYFTHRTGHSIYSDEGPHGPGVNIDDYESHDFREIVDGNSFSLEPGIYLPEFGLRSETDVLIEGRQPIVVAGRQKEIVPLLKK